MRYPLFGYVCLFSIGSFFDKEGEAVLGGSCPGSSGPLSDRDDRFTGEDVRHLLKSLREDGRRRLPRESPGAPRKAPPPCRVDGPWWTLGPSWYQDPSAPLFLSHARLRVSVPKPVSDMESVSLLRRPGHEVGSLGTPYKETPLFPSLPSPHLPPRHGPDLTTSKTRGFVEDLADGRRDRLDYSTLFWRTFYNFGHFTNLDKKQHNTRTSRKRKKEWVGGWGSKVSFHFNYSDLFPSSHALSLTTEVGLTPGPVPRQTTLDPSSFLSPLSSLLPCSPLSSVPTFFLLLSSSPPTSPGRGDRTSRRGRVGGVLVCVRG